MTLRAQRSKLSGDTAFAAVVAGVLRELRWDAEEDLSKLIGDIAAHRLVQAGRSFSAWQREAALNLAQGAAEFWTEEQPLLASQQSTPNNGRTPWTRCAMPPSGWKSASNACRG